MVFLMVSSHDRCSKVSNWQVIIVPGSGLSPNGRQTIIWTATFTDAYLRSRWVKPSHFAIHSTVWGKFFMLTTKKSVHYCFSCWLNSPHISPVMGQLCRYHDVSYVRWMCVLGWKLFSASPWSFMNILAVCYQLIQSSSHDCGNISMTPVR